MATLWDDKYRLNLKEIDAQHKKFFAMLENTDPMMEQTVLSEQDVYIAMRLILDFRNYGLFHFFTEEKLMIEKGYPDFLEHLDLHDEFMSKMSEYRKTFLGLFKTFTEGTDNSDDIFAFLKAFVKYVTVWFQQHISNEDAKYAYFINKQ